MTPGVTVDVAGAQMGGAARYAGELRNYLRRTGREDIRVIGEARRVGPAWLVRREMTSPRALRRIALNNVSFVAPGHEKWTLLRNALHFLTDSENAELAPSLQASVRREAAVVRFSAKRADVLVVPSTSMAERVMRLVPSVTPRMVVRPHPVSADSFPDYPRDAAILCPVLFASYKHADQSLADLLKALGEEGDAVKVRVTAKAEDVPPWLRADPRIEFLGRLDQHRLRQVWAQSRAIYFPTGLESFGYPLAEARACGFPVIARDSEQNKEIAGPALCSFTPGMPETLREAVAAALSKHIKADPEPFDPDAYFNWLLGAPA